MVLGREQRGVALHGGDRGDARQARVHEEEEQLGGLLLGRARRRAVPRLHRLLQGRLQGHHVAHGHQRVALGDASRLGEDLGGHHVHRRRHGRAGSVPPPRAGHTQHTRC